MPTKKQRIMTAIDDGTAKKIETVMRENGILEKSTFLTNAINYYLTSLTTDDISKTLITKDTTNEVRRSLNPVKKEMSEQNRITQIMLDVILRILTSPKNEITKNDFLDFVKSSVQDVDSEDGMNVLKISNSFVGDFSKFIKQDFSNSKIEEKPKIEKIEKSDSTKNENVSTVENEKEEILNKPKIDLSKIQDSIKPEHKENVSVNNDKTDSSQEPYGAWGTDIDLFHNF